MCRGENEPRREDRNPGRGAGFLPGQPPNPKQGAQPEGGSVLSPSSQMRKPRRLAGEVAELGSQRGRSAPEGFLLGSRGKGETPRSVFLHLKGPPPPVLGTVFFASLGKGQVASFRVSWFPPVHCLSPGKGASPLLPVPTPTQLAAQTTQRGPFKAGPEPAV